ncbi:hypothetical protein KUTeg_024858 [Tegillarca granosa]|uniref:Methyltransferase domain-containing protein n=1 Tax=Tegillarca granosa TaxID=220873 RepID=A0ABQ9DZ90_TEGGR|nr:hypothetical protein KUTeg_024858 [Tegillarca granosa]
MKTKWRSKKLKERLYFVSDSCVIVRVKMTLTKVYLSGSRQDSNTISVTLSSSSILFVACYCCPDDLEFVFVNDGFNRSQSVNFIEDSENDQECVLPVVVIEGSSLIRSGLCCTIRQIISIKHTQKPNEEYKELLVSGWTKLCEVELPHTISVLISHVRIKSNGSLEKQFDLKFRIPDKLEEQIDDDEMELSRRCRAKYRAIKPDVAATLDKIKVGQIQVEIGTHPKGDNVEIEWDTLPQVVSPGNDLPNKRVKRKCQQVENLVTAVMEIAKPGDKIVDYCSGGGHVGIVIAYLLPDCKVYLIENKEESLTRAKARIDKLNLSNCNMDYFKGKFDIGVCLHACGVATDMDYLTLGHAADQTEFNIALEEQGKYCMNLVDTDRASQARERGFTVTLCGLKPLICTPKNNLLIGIPKKS